MKFKNDWLKMYQYMYHPFIKILKLILMNGLYLNFDFLWLVEEVIPMSVACSILRQQRWVRSSAKCGHRIVASFRSRASTFVKDGDKLKLNCQIEWLIDDCIYLSYNTYSYESLRCSALSVSVYRYNKF